MPRYTITLDNADVRRTRSLLADTCYIVAALSVNGQMSGSPKTKFVSNQRKGNLPIDFSWPNVDVPATADARVNLWYSIVNKGGEQEDAETMRLLSEMAEKKVTAPKADVIEIAVEIGKEILKKLALGHCDGPITPIEGRMVEWHTFELAPMAPGTKGQETINERGGDSPWGCGDNSQYIVSFTVAAT